MLWNLLPFSFPAYNFWNMLKIANPNLYANFETMQESPHAQTVREIVKRVLNAENTEGSQYSERVADMISALPDSVTPRNVDSLFQHRFKVVASETDDHPIFTGGTDSGKGKYYIGIKSNFEINESSLNFTIAHELSHILEDDMMSLFGLRAGATFTVAALGTFVFGWSLPICLGSLMLTNAITRVSYSQYSERRADDFSIRHCSADHLEGGIQFLEMIKKRYRTNGSYSSKFVSWLYYPSEDSRIAKFRRAILEKTKGI